MKKQYALLFTVAIGLLLFSCTAKTDIHDMNDEKVLVDTIIPVVDSNKVVIEDTSIVVDSEGYVDDQKERELAMANAKVPQLDFCSCIVKIDSIAKAMETAEGADFDKLIELDTELTEKCKIILAHDSETPDQRKKHDRRVKKCLRNAK